MMRKCTEDEINRIRMCNARIRNENHLLRCTLRNLTADPYSECSKVLYSVVDHCTKKKCDPVSGGHGCSADPYQSDPCRPDPCCTKHAASRMSSRLTDPKRLCSPPYSSRYSSAATQSLPTSQLCSRPSCKYCYPSTYSFPYSKHYNRTNSSIPPWAADDTYNMSPNATRCDAKSPARNNSKSKSATSVHPEQQKNFSQWQSHCRPSSSYALRSNSGVKLETQPNYTYNTCNPFATDDTKFCSSHEEIKGISNNKCQELSSGSATSCRGTKPACGLGTCSWRRSRTPHSTRTGSSGCRSCSPNKASNHCFGDSRSPTSCQRKGKKVQLMSSSHDLDENESAACTRPCSKLLGELAFQLERRILDYVFGMEDSRRRRFYGYTVNNICEMMNKECKNVNGRDDTVRKSELAFRLKKLLTGLKKVDYDIKEHGDFAQKMINKYGLLPCPPDSYTIRDFGLHSASCIASLICHLACNEYEAKNLQILLNSLKYLSKCDGRPLFVW